MMRLTGLMTIIVCVLLASGCGGTVSVVPHAVRCDAKEDLLASKCAKPRTIPDDAIFADIVSTMREDRQALQECSIALDALRDSLNRCNQQTDEFNTKVDEINRLNAAKK